MNSITFSVFGSKPMFCVGVLKNIDLAEKVYPGWSVEVYHDNTVPQTYVDQYKQKGANVYDMTGNQIPGVFWRFFSKSDVFISRDCDSRLTEREARAVDEWLSSNKLLHVMRDHPAHQLPILAGMWGIKLKESNINLEATIHKWWEFTGKKGWYYGQDQDFLKTIYNHYLQTDNILCHDSIGWFPNSLPFPTPFGPDYGFVGEIFDENDMKRPDHHQDWVRNAPAERKR